MNPFHKENVANADTWNKEGRGIGVGKEADTANIAGAEIQRITAQEKQKELALKDAQETQKAIAEINQRIASMGTSQEGQIATAFEGLNVDEAVAGIEEMTDAEIERTKIAAEEAKKLSPDAQEAAALKQYNKAKQAETKIFREYGETDKKIG